MPNHVRNIISFSKEVPEDRIHALFDYMKTEDPDSGEVQFDFNKLIPMPEALFVDSTIDCKEALILYKGCNLANLSTTEISELRKQVVSSHYMDMLVKQTLGDTSGNYLQKLLNGTNDDIFQLMKKTAPGEKLYARGETAYNNIKLYGATSWYDWRCQNWGTKWNSYEVSFDEIGRQIGFNTAWSCPVPVIEKLSQVFPDIPFILDYADEDFGSNAGQIEYDGKDFCHLEYEYNSSEACEAYVNIWGTSSCFYQDDDGTWHRYSCENCPNPC